MEHEDAPLVEIESARCVECGQSVDAREFSGGVYTAGPVITEESAIPRARFHSECGGRVELGEMRPRMALLR